MPLQTAPISAQQAAQVLAAAFEADEEFKATFWQHASPSERSLRALFDMHVLGDEMMGATLIGITSGNVPVAAMICRRSPWRWSRGLIPLMSRLPRVLWDYYRFVPSSVQTRIAPYSRWILSNLPKSPHILVTAIGVAPAHRGQNHARVMMDEVLRRSRADPKSNGVSISTYSKGKAGLYERLGFRTTNHNNHDGIESWVLYRDHDEIDQSGH